MPTAAEAARRAGSKGHSATAPFRRWAASGQLLAVPVGGLDRFPGFCFGPDGRPLPVVHRVARAVAGRLAGWDLAAWYLTPHAALHGRRPVDVLQEDPDAVVAAARTA